jgi:hypothetical protein
MCNQEKKREMHVSSIALFGFPLSLGSTLTAHLVQGMTISQTN